MFKQQKLAQMQEYKKDKINKVTRGSNRATYDVNKINKILEAGFIGFVGYIYEDQAISIPMAYGLIDNKIYLHGSLKNRMLHSIINQGKVSMTVMHLDALVLARSGFHHSVNYRSATIFANVEVVDNPMEKESALEVITDHMVPGRWSHLRPMNKKEFNATLVIKLDIQSASAKIRDIGVLDEKEDENLPIWAGLVPIKQTALLPIDDANLDAKTKVPKHVMDYYRAHK